ncbi:MAG: hypothetical protein ABIH70_06490 [Chloroflexota bacterium]
MEACTKRIYCADCQRLVKCRQEQVSGKDSVLCSRCGRLLWVHEPTGWKYAAKAAGS